LEIGWDYFLSHSAGAADPAANMALSNASVLMSAICATVLTLSRTTALMLTLTLTKSYELLLEYNHTNLYSSKKVS
jgi:hypothetical protein